MVAQWAKNWPTDLAVPGLSPALGEIFSIVNEPSTIIRAVHHPDVTELLLKRT